MRKFQFILFSALILSVQWSFGQDDEARLLRFPAISGDKIVFSYAGDLYTVSSSGGTARRLTSDIGYEMFARFSPDGKQIAFTGQYDGNTEVYTIPAEGGIPKRVTCTATLGRDVVSDRMGPNNIVMTWTPDGKQIVYRSRKQTFNDFKGQLFMVPSTGGMSTELPLSEGGFCSYSPDGKKLAFNRVFREFRTWKYYRGGMADDIRIFDLNTKEVKNITNNDAQDIFPMWAGDEIFFLSDRDRTMNIFVYNTKTGVTTKVTNFTEFDCKFPSIGGEFIVFENGGYLYKLNVNDKKAEKVTIHIASDFIYARNETKSAVKRIQNADLSPNGERVVFSARGEVFSVPSKKGITYNLTQTSGVHERDAVWSPDGKQIAYLSDQSGEFEVWVQPQDGSQPARQITKGADTYYFNIIWSPDSKKILWSDRKLRLRYADAESGAITEVYQARYGVMRDYAWSPDSKWITFSNPTENRFSVISVYNTDTKEIRNITDNWYDSGSPNFSADGKYLIFVSDRDFNPTYSQIEWNYAYENMGKVYLAVLSAKTLSPFALENDSVKIAATETPEKSDAKKEAKDDKKATDKNDSKQAKTVIDFDGIANRIISLPIASGNYGNVYCIDDKVYYNLYGDATKAKVYLLGKKEEKELGAFNFGISPNNKKMLVHEKTNWGVIDLPSDQVKLSETIDVNKMEAWVDYAQEWKQIYDESWRQMRDFFYVENMHGLDWKAMHDKYAPLVPYVRHRDDLTYIIGELIGELNIGHAYVQSGERPEPQRIKTGLLGAKISSDASGYFKIDKLLQGANWSNSLRSPLLEIGVNAHEGDYILAINGTSTKGVSDIYSLLVGKADTEVEITLNSSPAEKGARKVIVKPIADESTLYYYNWVQSNIEKVSKATNGEVGYIHIPDMSSEGLNEFVKYFYPQLNKKGLIIDDRGNGGGNVSPMILERLMREAGRSTMRRNLPDPNPVPNATLLGPKVCLIDKYSASDGDLFPYGFKRFGVGTVIGTRSWGGVVGISGSLPFIDGADLRKPEFASYSSEESKWIIEGHGVDPDIVIDNDPYREYMGSDDQLDKAISVIMEKIKTEYKPLPAIPAAPDKTK
ncbi:MAG TPA: PDZ domain-containing protein [Prolixibacteraceae bacterium]|nr:PDZ domain-containing protein [Prolixibacteraceae bacterium]